MQVLLTKVEWKYVIANPYDNLGMKIVCVYIYLSMFHVEFDFFFMAYHLFVSYSKPQYILDCKKNFFVSEY